jgi:hypothetical protein
MTRESVDLDAIELPAVDHPSTGRSGNPLPALWHPQR